jgi:cellulose synthase/poly-beta-1,6-N-acetylglucosamine synthase-like glycosyltransferase
MQAHHPQGVRGFFAAILKKMESEKIVAALFLTWVAAYVAAYGLYVTHGFARIPLESKLLIVLVPLFLVDVLRIAIESFGTRAFVTGREEMEKVTVVIPTYNGGKFLGATLEDLLVKFKAGQIIVSSNGSTDDTQEVANAYGVRLMHTPEPIGKVGAINAALGEVATPFCLILDDDVLVGKAVFPVSPLGNRYSGIAFRVFPIVTTWVTKVQAHEYRKSMDIGKAFHNASATVQNISGAIGLFKTDELRRQVALHTGEFCGEDLQRTLLIHLAKENKGVVIADSVVETEVPQTFSALWNQRIRGWNPGLYSNLGNYLKILVKKDVPWRLRYDAFYNAFLVVLTDPLRLASLPVLVFYPFITLLFYAIYVLLETIPYCVLKRKEPYWVVLLQPLYGVFNFLTRITAFAVFVYRRLTIRFAAMPHPDDHRQALAQYKLESVFASQLILLVLIFATISVAKPHVAEILTRKGYATLSETKEKVADMVGYTATAYADNEPPQ